MNIDLSDLRENYIAHHIQQLQEFVTQEETNKKNNPPCWQTRLDYSGHYYRAF
jgi:hypothetical protein